MTDWKLHEQAWQDYRDEAADEYIQAQRQAFLDGFEMAVAEAESFQKLREWCENERDKAEAQLEETDGKEYLWRRQAMTDVLVKLHQIGNLPESAKDD
jgi:hypothetical protein